MPFTGYNKLMRTGSSTDAFGSAETTAMDGPPLIADQIALDLMNTLAMTDSGLVDSLQSDADVLRWLHTQNLVLEGTLPPGKRSSLLTSTRSLRELVRSLVQRRKAGRPVGVKEINGFLAKSVSHLHLEKEGKTGIRVTRQYRQATPEQLLAPVAEAAADLLTNGDFDLVRNCEGPLCTLWFYDRTKAHRRRWCSMAVCGNRNKVAVFRQRAHKD